MEGTTQKTCLSLTVWQVRSVKTSYLNAEVWTVPVPGPKREREEGKLGLLSDVFISDWGGQEWARKGWKEERNTGAVTVGGGGVWKSSEQRRICVWEKNMILSQNFLFFYPYITVSQGQRNFFRGWRLYSPSAKESFFLFPGLWSKPLKTESCVICWKQGIRIKYWLHLQTY